MTSFKPQQRHLTIRGRRFHFTSCDGRPGNRPRAKLPYPPMWYLVFEGRRCPVLPCDPALSVPDLDMALRAWVEDNALGPVEPLPMAWALQAAAWTRWLAHWWGPS